MLSLSSGWSKSDHAYKEIMCPEVIKTYNDKMGGVDLWDQMIALYRTFLRSRKWTLRVISHLIDLSVVNSWREYQSVGERHKEKKIQGLMTFRLNVANGLLHCGKVVSSGKKRGRPRAADADADAEQPRATKRVQESHPQRELQFDCVDHLPHVDDRGNGHQTRCKYPGCSGKTNFFCKKCRVHLCLTKIKMCFTKYHENN